jgi:hypothetical protein
LHANAGDTRRNDEKIGYAEARLRPAGYDAAAFATIGLAEPKQA